MPGASGANTLTTPFASETAPGDMSLWPTLKSLAPGAMCVCHVAVSGVSPLATRVTELSFERS